MIKSILVLESVWDSQTVESKSVWPIVSEFANATGIRAFHQVFTDKISLIHWIDVFNNEKLPNSKLIYIASHGNTGRISGLKKEINIKTITNYLRRKRNIQYVHFGSCLVGNSKNLTELLSKSKYIKMAFGYNKTVDWVDSTMFDIMLWGRINSKDDNNGRKSHNVIKDLVGLEIAGLAEKLGFQLVYKFRSHLPIVWPRV